MPTVLTFTIGPSGKQYTTMTACIAANAKNLVTADEQHIYEFYTFVGGLADNNPFLGYTDDATRNIILRAAPSEVWDGVNLTSGFYFDSGGGVIRPISTIQNMELDGIVIVDGTIQVTNGGNFKSMTNCGSLNAEDDFIPNGFTGSIDKLLIVNPSDDGGVFFGSVNKLTVVGAGNRGIVSGSGSAITNSFSFGSTGVDFSDQGGTHSNNATEDATAAGANPQINRTTADFVNYAGGDYRTASASLLATAGTVDFIGYALEAGGGGITVTGTAIPTQTEADIVSGGKTIILTLNGDAFVASGATFDAERQGIIDGLNSAQTETTGWNNEVRDLEVVSSVVRDSDTQVTITLTASAAYDITAAETITATIPASALVTGTSPIIATPTFEVTAVGGLFQVAWARNSNYMIQ